MFNGSFLRVCRILRLVKKLDFAFLSLGGPSHGAQVWCLGRVPKHRNQWWADQSMVPGFGVSAECQSKGTSGKKYRACYLAPKTLSWCIF